MTVICNIYKTAQDLLPHFFHHYLSYGVNEFLFGLHDGTDNPIYSEIFDLRPSEAKIEIVESYRGQICGQKEGAALNKLRTHVKTNWVIPTDLDEFHLPLSFDSFPQLAEQCKEQTADYVLSTLRDMISSDGTVPLSISKDTPIDQQFPRHVNLTNGVLKAFCQKVSLSKQSFSLSDGHHNLGDGMVFDTTRRPFPQYGKTLHYKWFGHLLEKEEEKYRSYKDLGHDYSEENLRLLEHLRSHNGKLL